MNTKTFKFLFLSAQKIKNVLGIENYNAFIKKFKRSFLRIIFKKKYTANEIINVMKVMGLEKGSIVFIHSSMTEFYNYSGTAEELIRKLIEEIGEEGTLLMPAYPKSTSPKKSLDEVSFDVQNTTSGAGYLTEVFRKYPGVKRSINIQQSVCAYGKLADYFVSEHHRSLTAWDEFSPYFKMAQMDTLVFALGLPYFLGTMIHCTESILRTKYRYFQMFFRVEKEYKYRDEEGKLGMQRYLTHDFARKRSKKKIIKQYFDKTQFHYSKISNLRIEMVNAKYTLDLYLRLADIGITMYSIPSPKRYIDSSGKFLKVE